MYNCLMVAKVLFISDFKNGGGAERIMHINIEAAGRSNYKIYTLFCAKSFQLFKHITFKILYKIFCLFFSFWIVLFKLFILRPQIIHVYEFMHGLIFGLIPALYVYKLINPKVKVIISAHSPLLTLENMDSMRHSRNIFKKFPILFMLIYFYILHLDRVVNIITTPSIHMKHRIQKFLDKINNHVTQVIVLRNPVLNIDYYFDLNTSELPAIPPIKLIFVGRFDNLKRPQKFVEFIGPILKELDFAVEVTMVGDGPQFEGVKEYVIKNNLQKYIKLLGAKPHEETIKLMSNHHALIMYSAPKEENAPLVLTEAALTNIYMVLPDDEGGITELGKLYGATYWFEYDNAESLKKALRKLNERLKKTLARPRSNKELEKIKKLNNWERFAKEVLNLYK